MRGELERMVGGGVVGCAGVGESACGMLEDLTLDLDKN